MCLLIDDREDDRLRRYLSVYDLPVDTARLEFGDAMYEGHGPKRPVLVGWERKRISDFVSSMTDRRLSGHQLRGMRLTYDYLYLVIEGYWRPDPYGGIEHLDGKNWRPLYASRQGVNYRQVDSYISSLELRMNVIVCRTANTQETAALYASRYLGWQKPWADHHAHDQIYCKDLLAPLNRGRALISPREPGLIERIASQLPGIDRKAWDVAAHFQTVERMMLATPNEWQAIAGIGKVTANQVWNALRTNRTNNAH